MFEDAKQDFTNCSVCDNSFTDDECLKLKILMIDTVGAMKNLNKEELLETGVTEEEFQKIEKSMKRFGYNYGITGFQDSEFIL